MTGVVSMMNKSQVISLIRKSAGENNVEILPDLKLDLNDLDITLSQINYCLHTGDCLSLGDTVPLRKFSTTDDIDFEFFMKVSDRVFVSECDNEFEDDIEENLFLYVRGWFSLNKQQNLILVGDIFIADSNRNYIQAVT